jgi:hypothetical protein
MRMPRFVALAASGCLLALVVSLTGRGVPPEKEPLVDQVRRAIDRGVQYLRDVEAGNGNWEVDGMQSQGRPGGWTSLALLGLLNSGVKPDDPVIERGLKFLRTIPPEQTYVVGLQTMVFAAAGRDEDRERVQRNVDWLVKTRVYTGRDFMGWSYGKGIVGFTSDNSNTQYALLGLHDGHQAGAKIEAEVWKSIRDYYLKTQRIDPLSGTGGWGYAPHLANGPTLTMTTAGLCGLIIAGMELNEGRETILPNGAATNCGVYAENKPVTAALGWIGERFKVNYRGATYYNLYGLERAGRLTGERFLGGHDWYREGCEFLVHIQTADGYWPSLGGHDQWKVIATSFALLFLSKGRTPVLVTKLVHGPGEDWNNDRNDCRNLVAYAGKELFKGMPMAWQSFDARRGLIDNNREEMLGLAADMLQSPVAYMTGHQAPQLSDAEEQVLKEYIEQGGFLLGEACCGRPDFDRGFRDLMKRLFPDTPLKPLPPEHPLWRAHALVPPGEFKLEGIERGCKTVVVYSPQDMSCLWEAGPQKNARSQLAFRLGGNIIAYATGMEPPQPRLTAPRKIHDDPDQKRVPRGYLKVGQLRYDGDWQPAPRAMRNLMARLQEQDRLLVALQPEAVSPGQEALFDFKFLYLHGRGNFSFDEHGRENLRGVLGTGGLLLADACCGKKPFDASFRAFIKQLYPDHNLEVIPPNDELYGKELNGEAITTVRCRRDVAEGSAGSGYRSVEPFLEGIKVNGRWVVIYSKYDLGCALERHQSSDCLGHDFDSAARIGAAVVLYALKR